MIQYIKESFSIPFFIASVLLNVTTLIHTIYKIEIDHNYLSIIIFLDLLLMMFYLFDLRKKIGDEVKISFGKFSMSLIGGGIFCSLTLTPFYAIIMVFLLVSNFSQLDYTGSQEFPGFNFLTNSSNIWLSFLILLYLTLTFSNCLFRLKTTYILKEIFQIFSFKEFKFFNIFLSLLALSYFGIIWYNLTYLKLSWFYIIESFIKIFSFYLGPILTSYLVKLQSEKFIQHERK